MIQLILLSALRQNYPPVVGTIGTETGKTGLGESQKALWKRWTPNRLRRMDNLCGKREGRRFGRTRSKKVYGA